MVQKGSLVVKLSFWTIFKQYLTLDCSTREPCDPCCHLNDQINCQNNDSCGQGSHFENMLSLRRCPDKIFMFNHTAISSTDWQNAETLWSRHHFEDHNLGYWKVSQCQPYSSFVQAECHATWCRAPFWIFWRQGWGGGGVSWRIRFLMMTMQNLVLVCDLFYDEYREHLRYILVDKTSIHMFVKDFSLSE
jgi:hypothetical protein